ncbi:cytochrome c oxidase assembly protein [Thioalkalivibrio denitrificans]|uniref:Cytochrome c oxidase assembly protein CtaG n=1 Tax=Thioalkalivibrio denitrificans TaxID=108003 RepID=A0A1V3NE02_9GAMM|nr:cytochrome c oxidase assembly protein [Thioalkalivibrio denitrificans]OOG23092.1 cytochrome c oxidase assembly protein [Thioalkalivibrio denitrificans]
MERQPDARRHPHGRIVLWLGALVIGMFGFGFALVPLYELYCQVAGIPTVDQQRALNVQAAAGTGEVAEDRWVTVRFDTTVHPSLPWAVESQERSMRVQPGEMHEVIFVASNRSSRAVTGQAVPTVIPWRANDFFNKTECFCFQKQTLEGGERREMPLRFVVSPALPDEVTYVTLSYNIMRLDDTVAKVTE